MRYRFHLFLFLLAAAVSLPSSGDAAVVFHPGEKAHYVGPGEEEISGNAQEMFEAAQKAESRGDNGTAAKTYRALVRKHPHDALASPSAFRLGQVYEKSHDYLKAAGAYRVILENYPKSPNFDQSVEALFRIGELYLSGEKIKFLGVPIRTSKARSVEIFNVIIKNAPYGRYTARAQFDIGLVMEKEKDAVEAIKAFQTVVEKFPNDPLAADAQYQIGYIYFTSSRAGVRDPKAATNAKIGFEDFLFRYPKSEKAAQAKQNLKELEVKQTVDSFEVAKFYDKQRNYKAAVIYYNDVIRQEPGSAAGDHSKRRVAELRAKLGDGAFQSAAETAATAKRPKGTTTVTTRSSSSDGRGSSSGEAPSMMHTSPDDVAPLPPPEADESLPPPASLNPDKTTAPDVPPASATPTPEAAPTPEP